MKRKILLLLLLPLSMIVSAQYPYRNKPKVFIECHVQEFGKVDEKFAVQLASALRDEGWSVQSSAEKADYLLRVDGEAREYTRQVTKEETTYTYQKRRDTLLVVDAVSSANSADAVNANMGEFAMDNQSKSEQAARMHKTVVRDTIITQAHTTPSAYMYFAYMDAHVTLSSQEGVIYEDILEVKEGHTLGYAEAAKSASKEVINRITEIIPTKIKQK
mgnify:CR=1 FL=1